MAEPLIIAPQTDGTLHLTIEDDAGAVVTSAAIAEADVFSPRGVKVGDAVPLTYMSGDQTWTMDILANWSAVSGADLEGEYMVRLNFLSSGKHYGDRIRYIVVASDKD